MFASSIGRRFCTSVEVTFFDEKKSNDEKKKSNDEKKRVKMIKKGQQMTKNVIICLLFPSFGPFLSKMSLWSFDGKNGANEKKKEQTKTLPSLFFGLFLLSSDLKKKFAILFNGRPDVPRNGFCK